MKIKWVLAVIGLALIIGIGGKVFMDAKKDEKMMNDQNVEEENIEIERMSVVALKNTFAEIKSVEFEENDYDIMTDSYTFIVKMTTNSNKSVSFMYIYVEGSETIDSSVIKDEEVQIDGSTTNKVHVIYSNKEEGEV